LIFNTTEPKAIARITAAGATLPVTFESNPLQHVELCRELQSDTDMVFATTFDIYVRAPLTYGSDALGAAIPNVDFLTLDETDKAMNLAVMHATRDTEKSNIRSVDARQNTVKIPVTKPAKKTTRKR
jgi:hypothetical protein